MSYFWRRWKESSLLTSPFVLSIDRPVRHVRRYIRVARLQSKGGIEWAVSWLGDTLLGSDLLYNTSVLKHVSKKGNKTFCSRKKWKAIYKSVHTCNIHVPCHEQRVTKMSETCWAASRARLFPVSGMTRRADRLYASTICNGNYKYTPWKRAELPFHLSII